MTDERKTNSNMRWLMAAGLMSIAASAALAVHFAKVDQAADAREPYYATLGTPIVAYTPDPERIDHSVVRQLPPEPATPGEGVAVAAYDP